jgi:hypothetical protein
VALSAEPRELLPTATWPSKRQASKM